MLRSIIYGAIAIIVFSITSCNNKEFQKERPNIILILADDMGYSDLGCYGGEISTPNLDQLAENGLRFTQFYNNARCCPTRASLMTGLYPHQTGIGLMAGAQGYDLGLPGYRGYLNRNCVTIAEVLGKEGYNTLMTGKWHLGIENKERWPLQRGFDKYYGIISGACNYFHPVSPNGLTLGNDAVMPQGADYYTTDAFTDYAISFIQQTQKKNDNAFFLYLAFNAPHWPLQAPQEVINKYKGKYMDGWQNQRLRRLKRMKEMGIINSDLELTPQDSQEWDSLSEEKKKEMDLRMAIYAAQIDRIDQNIGRLVAYLKKMNIIENTVIFFLSDNGGTSGGGEFGGGPENILETKKGIFLSYGRVWGNVSNTPFRKYKCWVHEGGIATPLIVNWPQGIPGRNQGTFVREYGFIQDIMATCIDLADTQYPEKFNGKNITPISGKSLLPLIKGEEKRIHEEPIFWEHEGNKALRQGKYKLVQDYERDKQNNWELYDLEKDPTEMNDLSEEMSEKVKGMRSLYKEWAERNQVVPLDSILKLGKENENEFSIYSLGN